MTTTTNERVRRAFEGHRIVRVLDADPAESELDGGEVWFDGTNWRGYDGTSFVTFDTTADA